MNVLTAAWIAAGRPQVLDPATAGRCARCSAIGGQMVPTREVVSRVFTAFDGWADPGGPTVCPTCAWGYREPALRSGAHLVTASGPGLKRVTPAGILSILAAPLPGGAALVVPLRPGRKHLFPTAGWGRVTLDDLLLPWSAADCGRLEATTRLRDDGFGSRMLAAAAPAWPVLRKLPRGQWPRVLADWAALTPWRQRRPWLDLAIYATAARTEAAA